MADQVRETCRAGTSFWLESERLRLRRFTAGDFDFFAALQANPDVMRHVGGVKSREESRDLFRERVLEYYDANPGLGIWATMERRTGALAGMHLLNHIRGETIVQVGYILDQPFWGKGYATEMAIALLRYGFTDLALPHIAAITNLENVASQRVLQKAGLKRNGERAFPHPAYASQGPMAWFEVTRAEWMTR